jgi:hypothetical protein
VQILNGDQSAAECLIQAVYSEPSVPLSGSELEQLPYISVQEEYGVWIDPIGKHYQILLRALFLNFSDSLGTGIFKVLS